MSDSSDNEYFSDGMTEDVRRAGDRVRIVAQLIDASTDRRQWAETYDRDLTDLFAVQSDVARSIAAALEAEEMCSCLAQWAAARPSPQAFRASIRARPLLVLEHERGVAATYLASSIDYREQQRRLQRAEEGGYGLIYVAPERLANPAA